MPRYVRVLFGYTILALALTWPLVTRFATHVPGDGIDDPSLAWNLWWVKHALVDQPQNPFACTWQFWPIGINLAFYTLTVLNGMLSVPVQATFGLIPAYNLLLLLSFILSGLGGYLLAREFLRDSLAHNNGWRRWIDFAAFLGGALYAFASSKLVYAALGQGNIASSQWAPFAALYLWRAAQSRGRVHDAVLAGLFLVLQAYAELTYASFLLIFAGIAFVWGLFPLRASTKLSRTPPANGRVGILLRFALAGVLFVAGIAPVLANMLPDMRAEGDFLTSGGGFADVFSADLAGYAAPTQLHPFLGGLIRSWSNNSMSRDSAQFAVDKGQQVYAGYVALALALGGLISCRKRRGAWLWAASAVIFFLLTLGPNLRIAGHDTGIPLPFRLVEVLPFFKGNRYPSRYSVMLLLSLAPLAAAGAHALLTSPRAVRRGAVLAPALLALMLFEHLSAPLPTFDLRVPALYERVAEQPGDFALLELPLGWRNGARVAGKQDILIMQQLWYQTRHGKRLLGGNTSRNPEYKFQYFSEQPTLSRLIAEINAADLQQHEALRSALAATPVTDANRIAARSWAAFTDIRYVMVHRDKLPASTEALARDLLPLTLVAEDGPLALYRVDAGDPPLTYRLASEADRMVLGEGWSMSAHGEDLGVFAQRSEVRLLLPLRGAAGVTLQANSLIPDQEMTLIVDGQRAGAARLGMEPGPVTFSLPPASTRPSLSDVRLRFSRTVDAAEFGQRLSRAGPTGLLIRSAGQEAGDFAHIYLDGREVSPNRRGYNMVALDTTGRYLEAANFDTHADPDAGRRLAEWMRGLAPGTVIAGAVRDEASANLGPDAVEALRGLGLAVDLRGHFRWGHAFLATVGAEAGWAQLSERADAIRPVQISFGLPINQPRLAAQVFSVVIFK